MKKIIILKNNNGRLANQLWLYISVYAFCLEIEYKCENRDFFEYEKYFPNINNNSLFVQIVLKYFLINFFPKRRGFRKLIYIKYVNFIEFFNKKNVVDTDIDGKIYLYPTTPTNKSKKIMKLLNSNNSLYLKGWLYRNPVGIKKYREEIKKKFSVTNKIEYNINKVICNLQSKYDILIGVHIRQGDYRKYQKGKFYFSPVFFNKILENLNEYLKKNNKNACFIICSDEKINKNIFPNINFIFGLGNEIEDLFMLAKTSFILGSNSTFGAFASYYGNIPMKIIKKENNYNWKYYLNMKTYFENKDNSVIQY